MGTQKRHTMKPYFVVVRIFIIVCIVMSNDNIYIIIVLSITAADVRVDLLVLVSLDLS
jgi:hypothetical protein